MTAVLLGLGSNLDRHKNLCWALEQLDQQLTNMRCSPVYESAAVGCQGDHYLNLVVGGNTALPLEQFSALLKALEDQCGRVRGPSKAVQQPLDIDLLTYADLVGTHAGIVLPRAEIIRNAYVLKPLSDLVPQQQHPQLQQSYQQLWQSYTGNQLVCCTTFEWRGKDLSAIALLDSALLGGAVSA